MYRITEPAPEDWDRFVAAQPRGHSMQQSAWAALKCAYGWEASRVALVTVESGQIAAGAQILYRALGRVASMAYIPMGPYVTGEDQWTLLWSAIRKRAIQHKAAFLKCEPGLYLDDPAPDFAAWGFVRSTQTVQPPRSIVIDLRGDDEAIMARMNQGTRRKIRKSLKSEIRYYEGSREDLAIFNQMMQTTGERNDFGVHAPEYYADMYDQFVPRGDGVLLLAEHDGDPLGGIMVLACGRMAWYPAGASSNVKRNLMATYGLQWQAIQWAQAHGCRYYDLWGVPDEDAETLEAQFQERSDGLWGVYGFKRGFGGRVTRSAGAWDKVYHNWLYNAYKLALRMRDYALD